MSGSIDHQKEQHLLRELRASHDPVSQRQAELLQKAYHDREMAALSKDVYETAKGEGHPPEGWIRASERPDVLYKYASQLGLSSEKMLNLLKPEESGFRAEIYIPDPRVLGPGYKPTAVFKGSSGQVLTSNGLRDTTTEDFLANNGPQAIGLETDYYVRAMNLAAELKIAHVDFELAGHSLGGGLASAASAVTGMPATTFNAAGLHPNTAARYAGQHGLPVYDVSQRITAYQVQGELLNDGLQRTVRDMDARQRGELAQTLEHLSRVVNEVPQGRAWLAQQLQQGVPPVSQPAVHAFVDALAGSDADRLLRDVPLAAGQVVPLAAMAWRDEQPVTREYVPGLSEVIARHEPVLAMARDLASAADLGARAGTLAQSAHTLTVSHLETQAAMAERLSERGAHQVDATIQVAGTAVQAIQHAAGASLIYAREAEAKLEAQLDRGIGQARAAGAALDANVLRGIGHVLPEDAQPWMQRQADQLERAGEQARRDGFAQAERALDEGRRTSADYGEIARSAQHATQAVATQMSELSHAAIAAPGHWAAQQLHTASAMTVRASEQMPALGAMAGAGVLAWEHFRPLHAARAAQLADAMTDGKQAGAEAVDRHLMQPTVLPSMDAYVQKMEYGATQTLQQPAVRSHEPGSPSQAHTTKELGFSQRLDRMLAAADMGDWQQFDRDTQAMASLRPGREMWSHTVQMATMEDKLIAQQEALQQLQQQVVQQQSVSHSRGMCR
ncbi:hypothetical protein [Dyella nitratireducens]|uniref:Phospholipase A(1) n=1 Tax=Dyella nitratireducens TaxID=1849580 RepID=A0ABQ1GUG6_9GAMM|nr:hypothetical protein [Dyella nitratireducens]GGA50644.1 phospholipase A(1) [Dyella nitratireducens]GLQ42618.1 phospholipase A(1) [Dyella nitratireducens]